MAETLVIENGDRVVQLKVPDVKVDGNYYTAWIDCSGNPSIENQRKMFSNEVYREIVVTDSHEEYEDSIYQDQPEFLTSEDEIDYLKERIMNLEQELLSTRELL